jgi:hypothetical protein
MEGVVILIIRHAEKPLNGPSLSATGQIRAQAYVDYFQNFTVAGKRLELDYLIAAADSDESRRPRLTLEPLSQALRLSLHTDIKDKDYEKVVHEVNSKKHHHAFLICWHHGEIPGLLQAFGIDPGTLLPDSKWPDDQFGWVLQLRYDSAGRIILDDTRRIEENINLSPGALASAG